MLDSVMSEFWQPMSTAPTDGTIFQVSYYDDWYPQCKINDGDILYQSTEVTWDDWNHLTKISDVIKPLPNGKYSMMWAPVPVLHDYK